jgi:hypothetical protein
MFYRGFDGPLLRQRFLEGNDTHEIKLILAVSRNANARREQNFTVGKRDWQEPGLGTVEWGEGRGSRGAGSERDRANRFRKAEASRESKGGNKLCDFGVIQESERAAL